MKEQKREHAYFPYKFILKIPSFVIYKLCESWLWKKFGFQAVSSPPKFYVFISYS